MMSCPVILMIPVSNMIIDGQMEVEKQQFSDERQERQRLLVERQAQETQTYDEESARLGFNALAIAEASCESGPDESSVGGSMYHMLPKYHMINHTL